jgi:hypothetical protein
MSAITLINSVDYALIIADPALRRDLVAEMQEVKAGKTTVDILAAYRSRIEAIAAAASHLKPAPRFGNARI